MRSFPPWLQRSISSTPALRLDVYVDPQPVPDLNRYDLGFLQVPEGFDASIVARTLSTSEAILCAAQLYRTARSALHTASAGQHLCVLAPHTPSASQEFCPVAQPAIHAGGAGARD